MREARKCARCGADYIAHKARQKYCGIGCSQQSTRDADRVRTKNRRDNGLDRACFLFHSDEHYEYLARMAEQEIPLRPREAPGQWERLASILNEPKKRRRRLLS